MEHFLARVVEYLKAQEQTPEVVELLSEIPKPRRVRLVLEYDLRTDQAAMSLDCIKSEDWTAFVNRAQTLVHVMRWGHPSLLIRLPKMDMKKYSRKAIRNTVSKRLYEDL